MDLLKQVAGRAVEKVASEAEEQARLERTTLELKDLLAGLDPDPRGEQP